MQNGEQPLGWRGFLATSADVIAVAGVAMGAILFFINMPPPIFFILIGVAATLLFVGIVGHVFMSNAQPVENLGGIRLGALVEPKQARITEGAGLALQIDHTGIGGKGNEEAVAIWTELPSPNIVCLGYADLSVELVRDVFRLSESSSETLRAVVIRFSNEPDPPRKVGAVNRVGAQILYYNCDIPARELGRVQFACWLNEESPYISFPNVGKEQNLVLGTFRKGKGFDEFSHQFTVYENIDDPSKPLTRWTYRDFFCFRILVKLIAGEHGEYSQKDEFELKSEGVHFTVEHLTEEKKQKRAQRFVTEIIERVSVGAQLFARPVENWKRFYGDAHEWLVRTEASILMNQGREGLERFHKLEKITTYPHQPPEGSQRIVDEFYTKFLNLKDIAEELTQGVLPQEPRPVRDAIRKSVDESAATQTGKAEIIMQLSAFAEEGALLLSKGRGTEVDWPRAKEWGARAEAYIRDHISEESAAWFSHATTEPAPGLACVRAHVDWIYTRWKKLGEFGAEVRKR